MRFAYLGGPFAERSGGLITFEASSRERAEKMTAHDPFAYAGRAAQSGVGYPGRNRARADLRARDGFAARGRVVSR